MKSTRQFSNLIQRIGDAVTIVKNRWFELTSVLVLVIGLGFVWYELYQTKIIAFTDGAVAAVEGEVASRGLILEHADVWRRGCSGEVLDENEELIFHHLVQTHVFPLFTRWLRQEAGLTDARPATFTGMVARNVRHFPGYRRIWETLSARYPPGFKSEVDRLATTDSELLRTIEQCGV